MTQDVARSQTSARSARIGAGGGWPLRGLGYRRARLHRLQAVGIAGRLGVRACCPGACCPRIDRGVVRAGARRRARRGAPCAVGTSGSSIDRGRIFPSAAALPAKPGDSPLRASRRAAHRRSTGELSRPSLSRQSRGIQPDRAPSAPRVRTSGHAVLQQLSDRSSSKRGVAPRTPATRRPTAGDSARSSKIPAEIIPNTSRARLCVTAADVVAARRGRCAGDLDREPRAGAPSGGPGRIDRHSRRRRGPRPRRAAGRAARRFGSCQPSSPRSWADLAVIEA